MNCHCNKPAVVRKISKAESVSFGKEFFGCSSNACNFFQLVGGALPYSVTSRLNNKPGSSSRKGLINLKISLCSYDVRRNSFWFSVQSAYSHLLMKYYNTIPEDLREYKESTRIWWFDMSIYERFICFMHSEAEYKDTFEVVELPRFLTRGIANYVEKINNYRMKSAAERTENVNNFDDTYKLQYIVDETNYDMILNRLDEKLQTKLLPFQLKGISFIINRAGRGLIGDEMGCGKTLQAIGCMQYYRNHWPVLILLPPTLINQWKHELLLNCSRSLLSDKDISVVKKASDVVCGKVTLISYFLLDKLTASKTLSPDRFGVVIADESQNLKNKDAKRTYNALPFLKQAKVAICLSGTPALNRPVELYTQLHAVVPYVFNDYDAFVRRYCDAKPSVFLPNVMDVRGSSNEIELRLLLESMVMIRRLKDEVISDEVLGSKLREVRYVHPNQGLMKQFDKLKKQERDIERKLHDPSIDVSTKSKYHNEQRILTNFRYQLTGKVKVHKVLEELRLLLQEAKKDKAVEMADKKESEMVASVTECIDVSDDEICRVGGKSGVPDDFMCGGDGEGSIESRDSIAEVAPIPINVVHYHPFVDDVLSEASSVGSADEDSYPVSFEDTTTRAELVRPEISVPSDDTATSYCSIDAASLLSPQPELLKKSMLASRAAPVIMKLEADGIGNGNKVDVASERGWSQSNPGLGELDLDEGLLNTQESVKVPYVRGLKRLRKTAHTSSSLKSRITPTLRCGGYKKAKMLCGASTCTSDEGSDSDDIEWTDAGENEICICKPNGRSEMLKKCTSAPSSNRGKGPDAVSEWDSDDDLLFFDCAFNEAPKNDDAIADKITMESIHCAEGPHGSVGMQHSSDAIRPRNSTTKLKMGTNQKLENQSLNKSSANGDKSDPETKIAKKASHKILVFGHHKDVMDELEEGIREMDVDYIRIDGQTSLAQRNACVLRFQGDDVTNVALLSMTATGTGLNLTRANVVLFAELNWVPGQLLQCEDRIHRLGQTCRSVRIIYVLAKGTGDEAMWEQVQKKHSVLDATVGICSDNKKAQHQKKPAQPSIATALMSYPTSNPSVASGRPVIQPQITGTVSTNTTRHVTQCSNRTGTGMTIDKRLSDKGLICGPSTVPFSDSAPTNNYHPNGNGIVGQSTLTSYFGLKQGSNQTVTDSSFVTGTSQNGQDSAQFSLFLSEGSKGNAGINPPVLNDISDATHMHSSPLKTVLSESKPSPELKRKIEASRQKALSLLKQKVVAPVGNLSHPENFSLHQSQTVNQKDTCRGQPSVKLSAVSERSNQLDVDLTNSETTVPPSNMKKIIEANRQLALEKLRAKNMLPQPIRPAAAHLEAKATDSGVVFQSGRGTKVAQVSGDKIAEVTRSMFS